MEKITIAIVVLGITGFLFSLLLALLSKKLKVAENPQTAKILDLLPGLNCGACGFSGCRAYAQAVAAECNVFSGCLPAGAEVNKQIAEMLGLIGCVSADKPVVICHCAAKGGEKKSSANYIGPNTCRAAEITGGPIDCIYGCLGFGDCVKVCPRGALTLKEKSIEVNIKKCSGCGKCLNICPRKLFETVQLTPGLDLYNVACNNKDPALAVKKVCGRGCIGCGICTRVEDSPYYLKNNLALIDYRKAEKLKSLEAGKIKCPTKCILSQSR